MKVYYSCVVDINPKFHYQCWLWVHSLIEMAKINPQNIWVHYIKEVNLTFVEKLKSLGVQVKQIESFGDGKYCNKIAQLSNEALRNADVLILMDTDMIVTKDFSNEINLNCVSGKIVDLPNPEILVLNKIFSEAGIERTFGEIKTDLSEELTYAGNFNGGLYVIPQKYIESVYTSWRKWALWLLDMKLLHEAGKGTHVDQVSFCMAIHENGIPIEHLHRKYNFPTHINFLKDIAPVVIHYHWELDEVGLLKINPNSTSDYKKCISEVNELIKRHFDNEVFWNYRYSVHPELGSGIGSRGNNLETKKDYLKRLEIEDHSVLDIGCGDLELMKDFRIKSYVGIDSSDEALNKARLLRYDWEFIKTDSIPINEIPSKDYVICFDVLIHQKNEGDFNNLISLMINKTEERLLVSGYTRKQKHHDTNHMLVYHQSLYDILKNNGKFESVIKLFKINDTDYYACDVRFDKKFWKDVFYNLIADKIPELKGKRIYLHIGTPKTGTSSLQKYLYKNKEELYKQSVLYPDYVFNDRHQSLVSAMINNDWLSFMQFFERIVEKLSNANTIVISSEGFYNYTAQFSEVAKLFWQVISEITNFKVVVYIRRQDEFLESFYRQCVINPKDNYNIYGQDLNIEDFLRNERVKANLDYETSLKTWCEIAGNNKVIVRPYQSDVIKDFLGLLNIDNSGFKAIENQNLSLPTIAVELIRRCNGFLDKHLQQLVVKEVQELFADNKSIQSFVNDDLKEKINKKYEESNKRLAEKWPSISNTLTDLSISTSSSKKYKSDGYSFSLNRKGISRYAYLLKQFVNQIRDYYTIKTSGLFDKGYYVAINPDVKNSAIGPVFHYVRHGAIEKRNPSRQFDTNFYLISNKDVASAGLNPLAHYIRFGQYEGRQSYDNTFEKKMKSELINSTDALNDMSSEDMKRAIKDVEHPYEFFEVVKTSRKVFGWYTKHYPRIYEYPWLLNRLKGGIKGKHIADLGAGLTPMPIILTKYGASVTTIDNHTKVRTNEELFNSNEWGYFNYNNINSCITSLNLTINENTFTNDVFDVWYSISVVEHMPAKVRRKIFTSMKKSLKNKGRLLLTLDLVKGTNKLWNYSEGKVIEETNSHGTLFDIEEELKHLGFIINESRKINLRDNERVDLGLIDAKLSNIKIELIKRT